jgi:hypothetical protein
MKLILTKSTHLDLLRLVSKYISNNEIMIKKHQNKDFG